MIEKTRRRLKHGAFAACLFLSLGWGPCPGGGEKCKELVKQQAGDRICLSKITIETKQDIGVGIILQTFSLAAADTTTCEFVCCAPKALVENIAAVDIAMNNAWATIAVGLLGDAAARKDALAKAADLKKLLDMFNAASLIQIQNTSSCGAKVQAAPVSKVPGSSQGTMSVMGIEDAARNVVALVEGWRKK